MFGEAGLFRLGFVPSSTGSGQQRLEKQTLELSTRRKGSRCTSLYFVVLRCLVIADKRVSHCDQDLWNDSQEPDVAELSEVDLVFETFM